jgi:shikimate kinase
MRPTSPRSADPPPTGPAEVDRRHLVLVGMMGAGKSSVGRRLALRMGRPFVDTDELIEQNAGRTVAEIFAEQGEGAFRALEVEAVAAALTSPDPAVVAFGGGAVLDAGNRACAREHGCVVWLQAPAWDLARRVASSQRRTAGAARPLLGGKRPSEDVLAEMAEAREPAYRESAHLEVVTTNRSPGQVATAILSALGWEPAMNGPGQ